MENNSIEPYKDNFDHEQIKHDQAYARAKKKLKKLLGFYRHLTVYILVNIFLIILITVNRDDNEGFWDFRTFSTAIFWGIGLMFHFFGVFAPDFLFGKNWEERKMKEYMDKDKEEIKRFE
jgi:pilus assembly protein TadC